MYHAIVKRIARRNFLRVNDKDYDALLRDCAPDIHHRFGVIMHWAANVMTGRRFVNGPAGLGA